jgi:hypothetical protein
VDECYHERFSFAACGRSFSGACREWFDPIDAGRGERVWELIERLIRGALHFAFRSFAGY